MSFSDVPLGYFFYPYIKYLVDKDIIQGYENGLFGENDSITRAQIAVMIVRVRPDLNLKNTKSEFKDVPTGYCAEGEIAAAHKAGFPDGFRNETFGSDDHITGAQLSKMVANAFDSRVNDSNLVGFADVDDGYWAKEYFDALASNDIVVGDGSGLFSSDDQATRDHTFVKSNEEEIGR